MGIKEAVENYNEGFDTNQDEEVILDFARRAITPLDKPPANGLYWVEGVELPARVVCSNWTMGGGIWHYWCRNRGGWYAVGTRKVWPCTDPRPPEKR